MRIRIPAAALILWLFAAPIAAATVYVVVGADTSSVLNTAGVHVEDAGEREIMFDMTPMSDGVYPTIMSEDFRLAHTDSAGEPIVFTWWMLTGGWHQFAINVDAVAATRVYLENWREQSERWGDEIALHFHHFDWNGSDWVMASTFAETIWDFEWSISQLVLDSGVMPVSFRSGWNYMDNPYQQELERWIPFRLEGGSWMAQDVPYHPSFTDYRQPGTMRGWEVRHRYLGGLSQATINQIFAWANAGQDQVTCLWSHQYESGFIAPQIENAHAYLQSASVSYPAVDFRYVTAHEALRLWQGSDDVTPPPLTATLESGRLEIVSESDIFQITQPWVAARMASDEYVRIDAVALEPGHWEIDPLPPGIDHLAVAVCDLMGNATIREVRDGSRRWSSQSEFTSAGLLNADALSIAGQVTLERTSLSPAIAQTNQDGAEEPLLRSYWIGQTFIPSQPGVTQVSVGLTVDSGPAGVRIELREVDATGFPDMSTAGLLASGEGSLAASGDLLIAVPFSGLTLDGRQYALVFLRTGGEFQIRLHTAGTMTSGNLVRAYSMDWIQIPAFDCRFQIYDQDGLPAEGQTTHNGDAFGHETGRFLSQTFTSTAETIDSLEIRVASSLDAEILEVQLRRTEPSGQPDLSPKGLIASAGAPVSGPGLVALEPRWTIPPGDVGDLLALTFVSPQEGRNSIALERQSTDAYPGGSLFLSDDADTTPLPGDLWFRILTAGFVPSGTVTLDFDSGSPSLWTGGQWEADVPSPATSVRARFAFADSQGDLSTPLWTDWVTTTPFTVTPSESGRWVRAEISLETSNGAETPTLRSIEIDYEEALGSAVHGLLYR